MDGVIIDTEPLYTKGEILLFKEYGIEIPPEDWVLFRGCNEQIFYDLSMNRYKIKEDLEIFIEKGRKYVMAEFENNIEFMNGFKDFHISLLKNGIKTALVTASPNEMFNYVDGRLFIRVYNNTDADRDSIMTVYGDANNADSATSDDFNRNETAKKIDDVAVTNEEFLQNSN